MVRAVEDGPSQRWLTQAKFDAPKHEVRLVVRGHLLERLDEFLGKRLGLVVAPAGFGKSTLMAQWRERQKALGALVAWLSLDEADSEPLQFFSYLILALNEAGLDLGWLVPLAEQGLMDSALRAATSSMLEAIAKSQSVVLLILDDYHRINAPAVDRLLSGIIGAAPHNFTIALASRVRPHLDLSRLLAAGVAAEIDADPLRISREDIEKALDRPMDPAALDLLYAKTEGWPVALQLARFLLRSDDEGLTFLEKFKGDSGHIAAYLTDQVLSSVTDDQRSFLLKTSVLERFDAALADAVTGRADSRDMLAHLEYLNALLVPLSEPHGWFRYHHLFAEYLQDQLRRQCGAEVRQLHVNASYWFEQNNDLAEAVRHAREAEDFARCAALVEQAGGWELILFGGIGYLRNLLRNIPESIMAEFPRIQIAQAYLHVKDGRLSDARALYDAAREAGLGALPTSKLRRDLLNICALLDVYEDQPMRPADFDHLRATIAKLPPSDPLTIAILTCQQILGALALGRIAEAEMRAQEAMRSMRRARTVLGLNYCFLHAGLAAFYQGRFQIAEAHYGVAHRMAVDNFASDPGLKSLSNFLMVVLHHWRGRLTEDQRAGFLADAEHVESYDGWFELYANGLEVECAQHESPAPAIARARRIASERGLRRLELLADAQSLRHGMGRGDYAIAQQLKLALPAGVWRRDPFLWRPYVESRLAMARHLLDSDRVAAIQALDEAIECCRFTGAVIYLIDALALHALVLDRSGDRAGALSDLVEALSMAAPERIARPFERSREFVPLLRAVIKTSKEEYVDILVISFANDLLARSAAQNVSDGAFDGQAHLSPREQEVLDALANGHSNKEIARALDMTENTVKFHLKNIFAKLKVERRAQAIARARGVASV
jgi:LuxR family maltose regulon positive regulatory protein